jgi:hypothetical protein
LRTLFLIALAAGLAAPALAADPATPARAPHAGWARPDFAKMRAQHVDDVALLLGLRADQRPALDSFLTAIEPHHGPREGGMTRPPEGATPPAADEGTLARLDRMSAHLDRRDADAKQKIEATRKFYASLTPEQQRRFDALDRLHHHAMGERMGMHGGGWRGHRRGGPGGKDMPPPPPQN